MSLSIAEFDIILDVVKRAISGEECISARDYECKHCYDIHVSVNDSWSYPFKFMGLCERCLDKRTEKMFDE